MTMRGQFIPSPAPGYGYTSKCFDDRFTWSGIASDRSSIQVQVLPIVWLHTAVLSFDKLFCSSIRSLSSSVELIKYGQRNIDATDAIAPYAHFYRPCWRHGYRPGFHGRRISCTIPSDSGIILVYLTHTVCRSTSTKWYCHARARTPRSRHCIPSNASRRARFNAVVCTAFISYWSRPRLSD